MKSKSSIIEAQETTRQEAIDQELCVHIFTVSAGLVGVCLTVLGLFRVIFRLSKVHEISDGLVAVDALGFLASCVLAYLGLRATNKARRRQLQLLADIAFLMSLSFMVVTGCLIAYEFV